MASARRRRVPASLGRTFLFSMSAASAPPRFRSTPGTSSLTGSPLPTRLPPRWEATKGHAQRRCRPVLLFASGCPSVSSGSCSTGCKRFLREVAVQGVAERGVLAIVPTTIIYCLRSRFQTRALLWLHWHFGTRFGHSDDVVSWRTAFECGIRSDGFARDFISLQRPSSLAPFIQPPPLAETRSLGDCWTGRCDSYGLVVSPLVRIVHAMSPPNWPQSRIDNKRATGARELGRVLDARAEAEPQVAIDGLDAGEVENAWGLTFQHQTWAEYKDHLLGAFDTFFARDPGDLTVHERTMRVGLLSLLDPALRIDDSPVPRQIFTVSRTLRDVDRNFGRWQEQNPTWSVTRLDDLGMHDWVVQEFGPTSSEADSSGARLVAGYGRLHKAVLKGEQPRASSTTCH